LTIAFNNEYKLYKKCKVLGSKKIKNMLKIETYDNLVRNATKDNRPLGNYIKSQLKKILTQVRQNSSKKSKIGQF